MKRFKSNKFYCSIILTLSLVVLLVSNSTAEVKLDDMFNDNMVLQRDIAIPIWGKANPNETVVVEYIPDNESGKEKQKVSVQADNKGVWKLKLQPLSVNSKGARIVVKGDKTNKQVELKNVLVGEVWFGSGQSNMAYGTRHFTKYDPDLKKACEGGPYPMLRVYVDKKWQIADAKSIHHFSALLFSFGHALQKKLDVPVGLMVSARNGTPSGRWMTEEMAASSPEFMKMFKKNSGFKSFDEFNADWRKKRDEWKFEKNKAKAEGRKSPRFNYAGHPMGDLYKSYIMPFVPFAIRGVLWDQGESKTMVPGVDQYTTMNALIAGWRKAWSQGDFPFLHVQKLSGGGCAWDSDYPAGRKPPLKWEPLPEQPLPVERKCDIYLQHIKMGTIKNARL